MKSIQNHQSRAVLTYQTKCLGPGGCCYLVVSTCWGIASRTSTRPRALRTREQAFLGSRQSTCTRKQVRAAAERRRVRARERRNHRRAAWTHSNWKDRMASTNVRCWRPVRQCEAKRVTRPAMNAARVPSVRPHAAPPGASAWGSGGDPFRTQPRWRPKVGREWRRSQAAERSHQLRRQLTRSSARQTSGQRRRRRTQHSKQRSARAPRRRLRWRARLRRRPGRWPAWSRLRPPLRRAAQPARGQPRRVRRRAPRARARLSLCAAPRAAASAAARAGWWGHVGRRGKR
mmetsp:Transcript_21120/g.55601  ORF Transcript_21120/g.55601 Transcript_21120/m.55601 type:complete len:288 (+) Transcript_21120:187-1050(+)